MKFIKKSVFGRIIYQCNSVTATQLKNKLYVAVDNEPKYFAGFVNINSVSKFFDNIDIWDTNFYDLGFEQTSDTCWEYHENSLDIVITYDTFNETFEICSNLGKSSPDWVKSGIRSGIEVIRYIFDIFDSGGFFTITLFLSVIIWFSSFFINCFNLSIKYLK